MRYELLGHEGGMERLILLVWRKPFGAYFTVRSPWVSDRAWRIRLGVGTARTLQFKKHTRDRCHACREIIQPDIDVHACAA